MNPCEQCKDWKKLRIEGECPYCLRQAWPPPAVKNEIAPQAYAEFTVYSPEQGFRRSTYIPINGRGFVRALAEELEQAISNYEKNKDVES